MKLSELISQNEYRTCSVFEDINIACVERKIEKVRPGTLFVCIRGKNVDTHTLLREAVRAGSVAVIVEIGCGFQRLPGIPILEVKNSRIAFAHACSRFYGSPEKKLKMIGITGTNGKTTTAHMLVSMLRQNKIACGLIGTVCCETRTGERKKLKGAVTMTTPEPEVLYPLLAEMVENKMTHAVMEVSSHALVQGRVAPIEFSVAVFTNLSPEHLDYHQTMDEYLKAKATLFKQCQKAAVLIDSCGAEAICEAAAGEVYTCSRKNPEHVYASISAPQGYTVKGSLVKIRLKNEEIEAFLPLPGVFSLDNALCAALAAHLLGVPAKTIGNAISNQETVPGRMESVPIPGNEFSLIIDYAHTERALRLLLESIRSGMKESEGRLILLFGCGGERDREKRAAMGKCAEELSDFTIVTSDNSRREDPKQIIREILRGMPSKSKRRVIIRREKAIAYAISIAKAGDVLLLVGKGHETYQAIDGRLIPFDERKIVKELLEKRESVHTKPGTSTGDEP